MLSYTYLDTPVGKLLVAGKNGALYRVCFEHARRPCSPNPEWRKTAEGIERAVEQLQAYFAHELTRFDLELAPEGTPFQVTVWRTLAAIPYGMTISYAELARRVGRPKASRAVGAANGANPLPIVLPCHRVVGSSGQLVGFGGGLDVKRTLLQMEGCTLASAWQ